MKGDKKIINYKYYIVDDLGFTYEIKSFEGLHDVKPKEVEEMAVLMADEKGESIEVTEVIKKLFIGDVMILETHYEKGVVSK